MPKKSNLEIALEKQIESLGGVQAEMIRAHVLAWKWNKNRIIDIQNALKVGKVGGEEINDRARTSLINERHKLVSECSQLYSHINRALKNAPEESDEFDEFMNGR